MGQKQGRNGAILFHCPAAIASSPGSGASDTLRISPRSKADQQAADTFTALPIRYLMHAGVVIRENPDVQITGDWPDHWQFRRYQDLGVLCAFVYEQALRLGAAEAAEELSQVDRHCVANNRADYGLSLCS